MLLELEIENLALFQTARVPFGPGLNALTGETGAGKSLVLRALELVRGGRLESDKTRRGETRISALFRIDEGVDGRAAGRLGEHEESISIDDGELLLTRSVGADGRGRCYANGRLIPLNVLRTIGERLVDVLAQGEARRFDDPARRAELLDAFGGLAATKRRYDAAREAARAARDRQRRLADEAHERRRRHEFLLYQKGEIDAVDPARGEHDRMRDELAVIDAADRLRELCARALDVLYESDDAIVDRLAALERDAAGLSEAAGQILARAHGALARARGEIDEAVAEYRAALDRIDVDPVRREEVAERLDLLRRLLDRFGPTEDALFTGRERVEEELDRLRRDEDDLSGAGEEVARTDVELDASGRELDAARTECAARLVRSMRRTLEELGLEHARFEIDLVPHADDDVLRRSHASGPSAVEFLLAANPGHPLLPIAEVASGGESARVSLALHAALGDVLDIPLLVFDEIESGIGARLGESVGRTLREIARGRQVIAVTHLPQVAAYAAHHVRIAKRTEKGRTEAFAERLTGREREAEIATMMRGAHVDTTTRKEARALLHQAGDDA